MNNIQYSILQKTEGWSSEDIKVKRLGIQGTPGQQIEINEQTTIKLGVTGIYEIEFPDEYLYTISSLNIVDEPSRSGEEQPAVLIDMLVVTTETGGV